jgi:putative ABC transport system ATP-binding protein
VTDVSALFAFDGVTVRGDRGDRLAAVTATVPSGGITRLLGPSGAGKSTMLRLCNRLEVPDEGAVAFRGRPLAEADPLALRRQVGMVFQRPTVFAGTVRDNLRVATPDADGALMTEALVRADLAATFLHAEARELSGGEEQRVCVARTLIGASLPRPRRTNEGRVERAVT